MTMTQEHSGETAHTAVVPSPRGLELDAARWQVVLEARWRARLHELTELCVAFHDAAAETLAPQPHLSLRHLTRRAVHARQALAESDAALKRLAGGSFGRCEDCGAEIPVTSLRFEPEARYCPRCAV
jgi:RNA polymerase-binding transcription factor DksA